MSRVTRPPRGRYRGVVEWGFKAPDVLALLDHARRWSRPSAPFAVAPRMRSVTWVESRGSRRRSATRRLLAGGCGRNDKDILLQNIRANKEGPIVKVLAPTSDVEPDSRIVVWDIVLDKG